MSLKTENKTKVIRFITDDLEISSDDSEEEQIKTKCMVRSFLTKMCKIIKHKYSQEFFLFSE